MKVFLLGTGGAGGPPGRAKSCFLVETKSVRILLDVGEGCGSRLEELGLTLRDIDLVYLTHLHIDHYSGLMDACVRTMVRGGGRLTILVHENLAEEAQAVIKRAVPTSMHPQLRIVATREGYSIGDAKLTLTPAEHAVPAYGVLVEAEGLRVYYSGDTRPCPAAVEAARSADLVLFECAMPDGAEKAAAAAGHTTVSQALSLRKSMKDGAVLALVHLTVESERMLMRMSSLPSKVLVPYDKTLIGL